MNDKLILKTLIHLASEVRDIRKTLDLEVELDPELSQEDYDAWTALIAELEKAT